MINRWLIAGALLVSVGAWAQPADESTRPNSRYLGIQANQLMRQLLSFGNSTPTGNPYLITYGFNSEQTGVGLNFGLGYSFDESVTGDAIFERTSKFNDFFLRMGVEKKIWLNKRWILSWGGDLVFDRQTSNTTAKTNSDFNQSTITTSSRLGGWGLGPRFGVNFKVADYVFIGTDLNYYLKFLNNTSEVESKIRIRSFDPNTGQEIWVNQPSERTKTDDQLKKFQLNPPSVIYLVFRV